LDIGLRTPSSKKIILFRNLTVETGCRGGQGLPRAVVPTGRHVMNVRVEVLVVG
jgi:hypothetical protein